MSADPHPADLAQDEEESRHRPLPHSLEAEKGLLSSMLLATEIVCTAVEDVPADAFYLPAHQTVFQLMLDRWAAGQSLDIILLTQALREHGQLDAVGGPAFVTELLTYVPTAHNFRYYLDIVREKKALRMVIQGGMAATSGGYEDSATPDELADALETTAKEARAMVVSEPHGILSHRDQVMAAINGIESIYERKGEPSGLRTGFTELDRLTGGLNPAEMIVIAARPSMGKTAFAMNIASHVALAGNEVGVFSLEMSSSQLIQRVLCSNARVNLQKIRDGYLSERDFPSLTNAAAKFAAAPIIIDDRAGISVMDVRAGARRMKKKLGDLKLIVIDYLQLLRSPSKRAQENRQLEISEISSGIKGLAKELNIPIIVLAQLNRNPENRSGDAKGRPRLSDLRESGSIEQDADTVGLLLREEYYTDGAEAKEAARGKATLIIAKQRNGPVDDVPLTFIKEFTRFEDRADEPAAPVRNRSEPTNEHESTWG